jgi:hypothetical protein
MRESQSKCGIEPAASPTRTAGAECEAARGITTADTKWTGVALLYGRPPSNFAAYCAMTVVPLAFRIVLEKFFEREEIHRAGLRRMAYDYFEWYSQHEDHKR